MEKKKVRTSYFIQHTSEIKKYVDLELPPIGKRLRVTEVHKFIEARQGARKAYVKEIEILEEYDNGYLARIVGPSKYIAQHNVKRFFTKNDFKKGLVTFSVL